MSEQMKRIYAELMQSLIRLTGSVFLIVSSVFMRGWLLAVLYKWFLLPRFPGIEQMSIQEGCGIYLMVCLAMKCGANDSQKEKLKFWDGFLVAFVKPIFLLAIAFLFKYIG